MLLTQLQILIATLVLATTTVWAESLFERKIEGKPLLQVFKEQGVPEAAITRSFKFLELYSGRKFTLEQNVRSRKGKVKTVREEMSIRDQYIAVVDLSLPSEDKRLYLMNVTTGNVDKYLVAHGKGSGVNIATKFSNKNNSKMTSLGMYLGGVTYHGGHGKSMRLIGLEPSNSRAAQRAVVMHSAAYVSEDNVKLYGRLGRSWGCPAVEKRALPHLVSTLERGGLLYLYHPQLMQQAQANPEYQELISANIQDGIDEDLPNEEEALQKQNHK